MMILRIFLALLVLGGVAQAQPGGGPTPPAGVSTSGGSTISPSYAGSNNSNAAFSVQAPSPLTGLVTWGFTNEGTVGDTEFTLTGNSGNGYNLLGLVQPTISRFATMTFRGPDYLFDQTTVCEHGAVGWVPTFSANTGALIVEASRTGCPTGTTNPILPPPQLTLSQAGYVDPTGGVNITCTTTNTSANLTSCGANSVANGRYIYGVGIPNATTVVSGGGTATMVMSNAATASNTETVNFANPTYTTRDVMDALPGTGGIAFRDFNAGVIIGIDRVNDRVGINTFAPAYPLDVNGSAQINGTLNFAGGGTISGGGGVPVSINPGSGITQLINNSSGVAVFNVAQASNVLGAGGGFSATTGTTNSSMGLSLLDQGGSPITLFNTGSAVGNTLWRAAAFLWQSAGGTTEITMSPGANTTFVHGIVAGLNTSGTIAGSVCATSGGTLLYESGATGCTISLAALKHDIAPLADASDLMALRPVSFGYNDPKMPQHRFGFIAEQVAAVDPTLSTYDGEGKLQAYDPNGVLALTVAVVQRQEREIRALIVAAVVLALWCAGLTALVVRRR